MSHKTATNISSQLKVIWASAANGFGTGVLTQATNALTFQASGDAIGASVPIVDGQELSIPSEDTTKFVVVRRTGTDDLAVDTVFIITDGQTSAREELITVDAAIQSSLNAIGAGQGDERIERERIENLRKHREALMSRQASEDTAAGIATDAPINSSIRFGIGG